MLRPIHVLGEIARRRQESLDVIRFFWVQVSIQYQDGDRDRFAEELRNSAGGHPLYPVVLRIGGFTDSNSVMADLDRVLDRAKDGLCTPMMQKRIKERGLLDVVLISRRDFGLAVTSSPIVLPDWFPLEPSTETRAAIIDLTWSASVSLSAPELHVGDIRRLLLELDRALVNSIQAAKRADHRRVNSLLARLKVKSFENFVRDANVVLAAVRNPLDYRPSTRNPTPVGQLWRATAETHADKLVSTANSLAQALSISKEKIGKYEEAIITVLSRPSRPISDPSDRWAFDMIMSVGAACRFVTAAAHADDYSRYPVWLVGSLSRDLRLALDRIVGVLEHDLYS